MLFCEIHPFVRFARYLAVADTGAYLKPYDCRLFYVKKGSAAVHADGNERVLRQCDGIVIHSGVMYRVTQTEEQTEVLAFNFDFTFRYADKKTPIPPDAPNKFVEKDLLEHISFSDMPVFDRVAYLPDMGRYEPMLLRAYDEFRRNLLYSETTAGAYFAQFLTAGARMLTEKENGTLSSSADHILLFLQQNYSSSITNRDLAALFHYHPNYLNSLIRAKTGMSLRQYLLHIRIAKAITLLETTCLSVTQIAQEVGFCDISYFSNYFKKVTGRSPKAFRSK